MKFHNYPNGPAWTKSELKVMSDNAGILSLREIAKIIGRSYTAVRAMSSRLSLGLRSNYKPWTREEIVFIKTSAGELSAASVAEKLCRSIDSVKGKARAGEVEHSRHAKKQEVSG